MTNENSSADCYIVVRDLSKMTETIIQKEGSSIPLGRRGENGIKEVSFNIGAWKRNLGDGTVYLVVRRSGEKESYKVNLDVKEDSAVWNVSRIDTSIEGMGVVQLTYVVDEQVAKTAVYSTYVESGIGEGYIVPATAYEIAVAHGFQGTEEEWLESLKGAGEGQGEKGEPGSSAYDIAVKNGYHGTEVEWIASLKGKDGKDGQPGAKGADGATIDKITLNKDSGGQITGGTAHLTNGSSVNIAIEQK